MSQSTATNIVSEHDISAEEERFYIYPNGSELHIDQPVKLFIVRGSAGLTHRVVDIEGNCYRPEPGYIGIKWNQVNGEPFTF